MENDFKPFSIRFGAYTKEQGKTPVTTTSQQLSLTKEGKIYLDKLIPKDKSFWYSVKVRQAREKNKNKGFLLIFDQFEELYTYPDEEVLKFKKELKEILNKQIPQRFREALEKQFEEDNLELTEKELELFHEEVEIKVLLAIRSDRMSLLNELKDYLPNILRHCYELDALSIEQAEDAILNPAFKKDKTFISPTFDFEDNGLDAILQFLTKNYSQKIESFQLQILCQNIEKKVIDKRLQKVTVADIGDIESIYKNHYDNLIEGIGAEEEQLAARRLIEEGLIFEEEERRLSLYEGQIFKSFGVSPDLLKRLVDSHLLRAEPSMQGGYTYELCHDTLVTPVLDAKKKRIEEEERIKAKEEQNRKRKEAEEERKREEERRLLAVERKGKRRAKLLAIVASLFAIGTFLLSIWAFNQRQIATDQRYRAEAALQEAENARFETRKALDAAHLQKEIADSLRIIAEGKITIIEKQKIEVENQRIIAESKAREAEIQKKLAEENLSFAQRQELIAQQEKEKALQAKISADEARIRAEAAEEKALQAQTDLKEIINLIGQYSERIEVKINEVYADTLEKTKTDISQLERNSKPSRLDIARKELELFKLEQEKFNKLIEAFKFTDELAKIDTLTPNLAENIMIEALELIEEGEGLSKLSERLGIAITQETFEFTDVGIGNELIGIVLLINSGKKVVANVKVQSIGTSPTLTDNYGQFRLIFPNHKSGDIVRIHAEKQGFEVVNEKELNQVILGRKEPVQVVLAIEGELQENKIRYYDIIKNSSTYLDSTYIHRAEELADKLVRLNLDDLEKDIESTLLSAELTKLQGDFSKSIDLYEIAIQYDSTNLKAWYGYGQVLEAMGDYQKSIDAFQTALSLASNDKEKSNILNTLGILHSRIGDYQKSLQFLEFATDYYKRPFYYTRVDRADYSSLLNNLAITYQDLGRLDKALEIQKKALEIDEQIFDAFHPTIARDYNNLSLIYQQLGQLDNALLWQKKALQIYEVSLGVSHPEVANNYNNLAVIYQQLGQFEKALEFQLKALNIDKQALGSEHPKTSRDYGNLATIYQQMGDYEKALEAQMKALENYQKVLGKAHPNLAKNYNNLGLIYQRLGDNKKALAIQLEALEIYRTFAKNNPEAYSSNLATLLQNLALTYYELGDFQKAKISIEESIEIYQKILPENHPTMQTAFELQKKIDDEN